MIFETGIVVNNEHGSLLVETIQRTACDTCIAEKGCGQSLLAKLTGKTNRIRVLLGDYPAESIELGQSITIGIPENVIVKGSLLVYMLPILMAVVGAWLCWACWAARRRRRRRRRRRAWAAASM